MGRMMIRLNSKFYSRSSIEQAIQAYFGVCDIKIISESSYPVDAMFEGFESARDAIVSIKVAAIKK